MIHPNPWWFLPLVAAGLLGTGAGVGYYLSRPSGQAMTPEEIEEERRRREAEQHTQALRVGLVTEQMAPFAVVGILGVAGVGAYLLWKSREDD